MFERIEGEHRQRMAAFQDQIDNAARVAGDRFVDETNERIARAVDSARHAMIDLVENGGCPCLSRAGTVPKARRYPSKAYGALLDIYPRVDNETDSGNTRGSHNNSEVRDSTTD
ncbi:hypothetical protein NX059_011853 [Plenodomus lindquistii]|nr:hypothetical protein NX059_011853 [Plenodomus lindquistii]